MSSFACMYLCALYVYDAHRGQEKVSDLVDLESQAVMSHCVNAGIISGSSARTISALIC